MTLIKVNKHPQAYNRSRFMPLFDEVFNDFFGGSLISNGALNKSAAVNIKEDDRSYHLEFAAPGFEKDEFKIGLENQVLTVSAEKKSETEDKGKDYTRREFVYSSFQRSFNLPESVNMEEIKAEYKKGILEVTIPKKESAKNPARQVPVQ